MKAVVTGMIGSYAVGGVAWDYGQYATALERLGYEVYYLEDTGTPTYDPRRGEYGDDCSCATDFLEKSLRRLSAPLARRWRFVNTDAGGNSRGFGMGDAEFREVLRSADLFLNVSNSALMRDEYLECPRRVLLDTDPGLNHFKSYLGWKAGERGWLGTHGWHAHTDFFTYALNLGRPECPLPDFGKRWFPTRPPVVLDAWHTDRAPGPAWTTVMTWKNFPKLIEHAGRTYGAKEFEFPKIEDVPRRVAASFEVAVGGNEAPRERWRDLGWVVRDSHAVTADVDVYRDYILGSLGEFSVAKNMYVATHCGWFSCRTVCYLAAGRPAVVQDTGFSRHFPCGEGLLAFTDTASAIAGLEAVARDPLGHAGAARAVAQKHFDSDVVLGEILDVAGLPRRVS